MKNTSVRTFEYDHDSRVVKQVDRGHRYTTTVVYEYDDLGRVVSEETTVEDSQESAVYRVMAATLSEPRPVER